ncbi:hypothetical protein DXV75_11770 [Alteromonas aestuariivivens]|uniref:DNA topoisomerase type IA zn finger domain-containing protein n=1 Tax=Alteromonas aestuariivivens TaxID=1938339 RepID=A0A3D8M6G4_9ALTE|nr:topoisomerase DNA-binding C4 zinc finger domain-containing protein [Alteromonas aestuariivivens]RDV24752.1 hypothetical protein DXV75_11770 [Alteromonas aestuariivivens]
MSKIDHSLFNADEHARSHTFGDCPECGKALRVRNSKSGPFIGCSGYPQCQFSKPLHDAQTTTLKVIEDTHCPECGNEMAIKKGRYGMFIGCTNFPACHHIEPIKAQNDTQLTCPKCQKGHLLERTNKYGKRFFACNHYPQCRYVLNFPPVAQACPQCGWSVLIDKKGKLCCPQTDCDYTQS